MNELAHLQSSLAQIFREALPASLSWGNPKAVKNLQEINHQLDGVSSAPSSASIAQVVASYRQSQSLPIFRDLKYACYGAATPMQDGWCVLGDDKLRDTLLADVERLDNAKRRFKCFEALLRSYFAFDRYEQQTKTTKEARNGWKILRDCLARQRAQFQRDGVNKKIRLPGWFAVLTKHENLLTNKPCDRYGVDMLRGDNSSIEEARQGLGIPKDSWVMQEMIISHMSEAANLVDAPFNKHLDLLLKVVQGETSLDISPLLKLRAIAVLVSRYAQCASKPEQPVLRDAAVSIIGNPWLKKTHWDAWVKKHDGQPDNEAREMVNGWLKRRLITDFFAVLSEDGRADQRRLKYWLRFETVIEDLWLALGPDAMRNMSKPYQELRERAVGRLLSLENSGPSNNNAFIMRMGDWLIVEFGITGNACYVYPRNPPPFVLQGKAVSLYKLKNRNLGEPHNHIANGWERNFDQAICSKVGYHPQGIIQQRAAQQVTKDDSMTLSGFWKRKSSQLDDKFTSNSVEHNLSYVEQYVRKFALRTEDLRKSGGAFWVYTKKGDHPEVDQNLESWKFKYKQGRGWWRE